MALSTYADLQDAIARWLLRDDLTTDIPDFIDLCEAQMQRRLRVSSMIGRATATITDGYSALPTDFAGLKSMDLNTNPPTGLDFSGSNEMVRRGTVYFATGKPSSFSIVGNEFQFSPAPDAAYTARLTYWKRIPALSDANPTNWLLTAHPDAYLYGSLVQSAPFLKADERLETWGRLFTTAMSDIETDDSWKSYGAAVAMKARSLG